MKRSFSGAALLRAAIVAALGMLAALPAASSAQGLAHRSFRLPNGLNVVVHEDHKAPIVSLAVWYHVGSGHEPAGRTGFAHLFEHLMFRGSKHHDAPFVDAMSQMGARNINGETWPDHTQYYATVPTMALDKALWLESDRMGHLLETLDDTRLQTERGVVHNERREAMELPHARTFAHLLRHIFPANHPYHHDAYGDPADLDRATIDDARAWFRDHYGPANATLVMAGDITPEAAREKAMAYFGDLAPGHDVVRRQPWLVPLHAPARGTMHSHVANRRIVRAWPMPQLGNDAAARLGLVARLLGNGATSRLHKRLVASDGLASKVDAHATPLALAGMFTVDIDVAEDADLAAVESALDDELRRFLTAGPDEEELALAKVRDHTDFLAETEHMDAKARRLAMGQAWLGDPGAAWETGERAAAASADDVRREAATWLTQPSYTLTILPAPEGFDAEAEDAADPGLGPATGEPAARVLSTQAFRAESGWGSDRRIVPVVEDNPVDFLFPSASRSRLGSGAAFVSVRRAGSELAHVRFLFRGGSAGNHGRLPGTALFTMAMIEEAAATKAYRLGATLDTACDLDACTVDLRIPRDKLREGLALTVDAIRHELQQDAIESVRKRFLAARNREKLEFSGLAERLMTRFLYGDDHPYGIGASGQGTRESVLALDKEAVEAYRRDYLRPDNLSVIMVGDVAHDEGARWLESAFAGWVPSATPLPSPLARAVARESGDVAYLVDQPGAQQVHLSVGLLAPPVAGDVDLELASRVFVGLSGSRLNANLRETRGWSYGMSGGVSRVSGDRSFAVHGPVQADRAGDAIAEIRREMAAVADGTAPLTEAEVANVRAGVVRSMAVTLETDGAMMVALSNSVKLGRRDDFWQTFPAMVRETDATRADGALKDLFSSRGRTWVIVGDRARIETQLRQQFPALRIVDADGAIVQ